ncbi:flavodoxin family protein [Methanoculleus sp. Wushi-C6]|uniref:Flavodoxin family protein n=1 Tax=Methanoculleus caldifontis TaxID=2651577 RepID=A0ABU3WYH7_9EURY|nr:flavodoxin family protein [Methanoculleus sp. Wushi-C6]MDV2480836.1 flavodoxin family protein [Methanoculleus sp. Wushi-C6]
MERQNFNTGNQKMVTLLMGSPRRNGSTRLLLNEAERALHDKGISTQGIFLDELTIHDCRGCHQCKTENNSRCTVQDDMQQVYRMMESSGGLIIAAPVYFGYVPAMTKAWLDRLVPYLGTDLSPRFPVHCPVSFIFVQNMPDPTLFEPALQSFAGWVAKTGMSVGEIMIATDCESGVKPPVSERPELMEEAYAIGTNLLG